ncbi:MAG: UDP-4-amino-4,6-dideoxy-N-acetyl-beta-L-altrosamine transaminase [Chlorobiaceae bacterium]|nr:UDP-4-amino-4,6-dideoxy-N-acetyl-beta-L-altrosamine transaminase [Chlorobiaceae bacterium]
MIPYGKQDVDQSDIHAVVSVLKSDFITQGPVVPAFERALADFCGTAHAVAVNSATSALHIACKALDVGIGDMVWTSPVTFVASANCALYCGASVDFVDIDPGTLNLSVECLTAKLELAERSGQLPKVVIPVHFAGQSCEMEAISKLARRYGFRIIEDASHAIGGRYQEGLIGNGRFSDITVFSFHPVKIITTGEGGMALTNDPALANRMQRLRSHGITRDECEMTAASDGPWYYQQIELGYNYRMTDIQAALGLSQSKRLKQFVERRNELALRYDRLLAGLPVTLQTLSSGCYSARHLYVVRLQLERIGRSRRDAFEAMRQRNIGVNLHYLPVYLQPFYSAMGFRQGYCVEAERYYAEAISLPLYPGLTEEEQDYVIENLREVLTA